MNSVKIIHTSDLHLDSRLGNFSPDNSKIRRQELKTSFEQALERYKLALACAVVKKGKVSEKAYVCLRMAWLLRSYGEFLATRDGDNKAMIESLKAQENEYEENVYLLTPSTYTTLFAIFNLYFLPGVRVTPIGEEVPPNNAVSAPAESIHIPNIDLPHETMEPNI